MGIVSVPEATYPAGTHEFHVSSSNHNEVRLTFTKPGWPGTDCLTISIHDPDGILIGSATFNGASDKSGQAVSSFGVRCPTGIKNGQFTFRFVLTQALTSALTIETR